MKYLLGLVLICCCGCAFEFKKSNEEKELNKSEKLGEVISYTNSLNMNMWIYKYKFDGHTFTVFSKSYSDGPVCAIHNPDCEKCLSQKKD